MRENIKKWIQYFRKRDIRFVISICFTLIAVCGSVFIGMSLFFRFSAANEAALEENNKEAKKMNDELYNINKIVYGESNPSPIKTAMYKAGHIESLEFRLPLCSPSKENFAKIEEVMKKYKIKGF